MTERKKQEPAELIWDSFLEKFSKKLEEIDKNMSFKDFFFHVSCFRLNKKEAKAILKFLESTGFVKITGYNERISAENHGKMPKIGQKRGKIHENSKKK